MRFLLSLIGFALMAAPVSAQELRSLETIDAGRGWQAVGRLDFDGKSFCTGTLIAEDLVLTAGHCLYDKDTGATYAPDTIEFRAGWRNGRASAYRGVRRAIVHPDFDLRQADRTARVANDLALLELDQPIRKSSVPPFATHAGPRKGAAVGVVSYARDRAEAPSLQETCMVLARIEGTLVLSCTAEFGASGAPVFIEEGGIAKVASVISAKAMVDDMPVSLGTSLTGPLDDLLALMAASDGFFTKVTPTAGASRGTGAKFVTP